MKRRASMGDDRSEWALRVISGEDPVESFAAAVVDAFDGLPRRLEARWLYDAHGSRLFDAITRLPEYPLYRAEDALLRDHAPEIADLLGPVTLVELGAGTSAKTRRLLDALVPRGARHYLAIDVSEAALRSGCASLARRYPNLSIEALVASYEQGLARLPAGGPRLLSFLGSSLGNLTREETDRFFARVRSCLAPGDHLLLGIDGLRPEERLVRAYDDPQGRTEAFILNVFARMNRELGAEVPLDQLRLVTRWEPEEEQIAMYARFERACTIALPSTGRSWRIDRGEEVLVEISRKFRPKRLAAQAARRGLALRRVFEDDRSGFALLLCRARP